MTKNRIFKVLLAAFLVAGLQTAALANTAVETPTAGSGGITAVAQEVDAAPEEDLSLDAETDENPVSGGEANPETGVGSGMLSAATLAAVGAGTAVICMKKK